MSDGLIENIKKAIRDILKENDDNPLGTDELVPLVDKKLSDGEINEQLVVTAVDIMLNQFELIRLSDGKLKLN